MTSDIEKLAARLGEIEIGTPMEDGQLFDNIFYMTNHIDVLESSFHPYDHFITHGRQEGRDFKTLDPSTLLSNQNEYLQPNLTSLVFLDRFENLAHAAAISDYGTGIEFGVHSGRTLSIIRQQHKGRVLGFDSFKGLPESWRKGFEKGHFATSKIPLVDNTIIIVGLFEDTVPGALQSLEAPITLIHFDADLFSSTAYALEQVTGHLAKRCIFIFDEYFNYPGWEDHDYLAFHQWQDNHPEFMVTMISQVPSNEQASFEITIR